MDPELQDDLILETLYPMLTHVQQQLSNIEARVMQFVPRRMITPSTKEKHIYVITMLGGRCPCCGISPVLDEHSQIYDAEFDHFWSRERITFEETWLICRPCHQDMRERVDYTLAFQCYQKRAAMLEGGQLSLSI